MTTAAVPRVVSTASGRLRAKIDLAYPVMHRAGARLWEHPRARELYPAYLLQLYGITQTATPLMEAALARCRELGAGDAVASELAPYFAHHAPEEAGHERWLLSDLAVLGYDADAVRRRMPSARVAEFVGSQYYWIRHHHPVSLLGHMAIVEGHPPRPGSAADLRERTGLPSAAFRTLERHEQLDAEHATELYELIDSLSLDAAHEVAMGVSALHTVHSGAAVFEEVLASVVRSTPPSTG